MQPPSLLEAQEWLTRAERDLAMATRSLEAPPLLEAVVYYAQQAAEKALKGFLTLHGRPFAKTHELVPLVAACQPIEPAFARFLAAARTLTPYVFQFRYPGSALEPPLPEAQQALQLATEIVEFVRQQIANATIP